MKILVTGSAGFIGFHLVSKLLKGGHHVIGLDSLNDYYDVSLKLDRVAEYGIEKTAIAYNKLISSSTHHHHSFIQLKIEDKENMHQFFAEQKFDAVANLAAQAGIRYSLTNPQAYIDSNIVGFANVLECCRHNKIGHLVYASSSSVYGLNESVPFNTNHTVDHPISLYAASKKSNELMAHSYSHLYNMPTTGLRFFTVYGPWGRPDMAFFLFTKAILAGEPIKVYNDGNMYRDFTFVDDIVEGVVRVIDRPAQPNKSWDAAAPSASSSKAPYKIYNIGNNSAVRLLDFINAIEDELRIEAVKELLPIQPGDVPITFADVTELIADLDYKPSTTVKDGVRKFIEWYKNYYKIR